MSKPVKNIAIINTKSSFNQADAREALDLALIYAAYDQQVSVIFKGDGVYQLLGDQQPKLIGGKDFLATMKAFDLYDIENVIISHECMNERGISEQDINLAHQTISLAAMGELFSTFDHILTV